MMEIKVSVVIATYKRPELLKKCLGCLVNQTLEKHLYEIIIVSDGPDDESEKAVREISAEASAIIHFLSLENKKGPAAARNAGWKKARGILIAFTDDDCLPDSTWLQTILLHYHNEAKIAFTGRVIVPVSDRPTDFELNTKGLEAGEFVTANCVLTKAALQTIEGFDEAFKAAWREDSDIHFKLIKKNISIIKLNDARIVHPVRKARWGISIKEQKKSMFNALLYKKYPRLYRQRIKSGPNWRYYFIILFFMVFVAAAFLELRLAALISFVCWLLLTTTFIFKRLSATRKTAHHIFEMIVTSVLIPFLSVYWTLYGSIKYRVLFF